MEIPGAFSFAFSSFFIEPSISQPQISATLSAQLVTFRAFLVSFLFSLWGQCAVRYRFGRDIFQIQCPHFDTAHKRQKTCVVIGQPIDSQAGNEFYFCIFILFFTNGASATSFENKPRGSALAPYIWAPRNRFVTREHTLELMHRVLHQ